MSISKTLTGDMGKRGSPQPDIGSGDPIVMGRENPMDPTRPADMPNQLTLFAEDSRARITALQESAAAWLVTVARSGGKCIGSLLSASPSGLSEKMYLGSFQATEAETSLPSSARLFNSGMASHGLLLTVNTSEWRNDGAACSLSDTLEECPDPKYSLSAKACEGILRRSARRGKQLPPALEHALRAVTTSAET